jgi:hypothetical protein
MRPEIQTQGGNKMKASVNAKNAIEAIECMLNNSELDQSDVNAVLDVLKALQGQNAAFEIKVDYKTEEILDENTPD